MKTHVDLKFVCQSTDQQAVSCLVALRDLGYECEFLGPDKTAPIGSVALYTGGNDSWPSRNFRVASHRLQENANRPKWTMTTPFLVAIRPGAKGQMLKAAQEVAKMYERWYKGETGAELPWETRNGPPSTYHSLVEGWMDQVAAVIGDNELLAILESQKLDKNKHAGRGGDIVFRVLRDTGNVVVNPDHLATKLPRNEAYFDLTGVEKAPVSYGTSDIMNFFELLQAIKLGYFLGLPVVFETYPSAHDVATWINGFLNPSLKILGAKVWSTDFTDEPGAKYTTIITREKLKRIIKSAKLDSVAHIILEWADQPMWVIYQNAAQYVAERILKALNISVDFRFTTTEDICRRTGIWDMRLSELAQTLRNIVDHDVVVYNTSDGHQVKTNMGMPDKTVAQIHEEGGWLGGAALYFMVYHLAEYGGVVVMVKDSTRGRVNLMAKPFLGKGSTLRLAPVGLFRMTAEEQNEDWSVDPLVLMEVIAQWGPEKLAQCAKVMWDSMQVPLAEEHIGNKTVVTVNLGGVKVRTQST